MKIRRDTVWKSGEVYDLGNRAIEIGPRATLTIEAGAKIIGGSFTVYGQLKATGSAKQKAVFEGSHIKFGGNHDMPGRVEMSFAKMDGGSFLYPDGNGGYGSFAIDRSEFTDVRGFYIWYPVQDSKISRSAFYDSDGLYILARDGSVTLAKNLFSTPMGGWWSSSNSAVSVAAAYGPEDLVTVRGNTFVIQDGEAALELPSGYSNAAMFTDGNYFGTTDLGEISDLVLDRGDSFERAGRIRDANPLEEPASGTPRLKPQKIVGGSENDRLIGTNVEDRIQGQGGDDTLRGGLGDDRLVGGKGNDRLIGGGGDDELYGGRDSDNLDGGKGQDLLSGGEGADTFVFRRVSDSKPGARDTIVDFETRIDKIDLRSIDADAGLAGVQSFTFLGKAGFSESAGELRFSKRKLQADLDGDGRADFVVEVLGGTVREGDLLL